MKKILATIMLLSLTLSFTACGKSEPKEISCEETIAAYEDAGYYVAHGTHKDEAEEAHKTDKCNLAVWFYARVW